MPPTHQGHGPAVIQILILKATYGGVDVTQKVQGLCQISGLVQTLSVTANNATFGDTAPGRLKALSVLYQRQNSPVYALSVSEGGTIQIGLNPGQSNVTIDQVAKALAPNIHLHSKDPHRPVAVETFLARCQVVRGQGSVSSGGMDLPSNMSIINAGPMTPASLAACSRSTNFGGNRDEDVSIFPLTSMAGPKHASWSSLALVQDYFFSIGFVFPDPPPPLSDPYFYNDQLLTLTGTSIPLNGAVSAPMYARIATREDYYLISYFGFFAYNGGIGALTSFSDRPLSAGSWGGHIGDWIRLTAKVRLVDNLVSLISVDYEAHGDQNIVTSSSFENKPFNEIAPISAYAGWHSHELYPDNGVLGLHPRIWVGFTANDFTDDGPLWQTSNNLVFISDDGPEWIFYNGLWGAYISVSGTPAKRLDNGPEGPSFHWYWTNETKGVASPIKQWRNDGGSLSLATPVLKVQGFGRPGDTVIVSWIPILRAAKYLVTVLHTPYSPTVSTIYTSNTSSNSFSFTTERNNIAVVDYLIEVTAYSEFTFSSRGEYLLSNVR